jgi:Tfp pilus assembly protein PilO
MWNVALLVSGLVLLAGIAAYFWPKPSAPATQAKMIRQIEESNKKTALQIDGAARLQGENAVMLWAGDAQSIAAKALANVSQIVKAKGLKLIAFRPQKSVEVGKLEELPFLITVEGPYPNVAAALKDLENPALKLAVGTVQIASNDGSSDRVNASFTVLAFREARSASIAQATKL